MAKLAVSKRVCFIYRRRTYSKTDCIVRYKRSNKNLSKNLP